MSHRRAFLRQLGTVVGAAGVSGVLGADRAMARSLERLDRLGEAGPARGGGARGPEGARLPAGARSAAGSAAPGETAPAPGWVRSLREEYLLDPEVRYLNHASIGTVPRAVREAHRGYLELAETNPWLHIWGGVWDEPREEVRRAAAAYVGARPEEMAITHNTTEGFNVLAAGLPLGPGDEVLFSDLNHPGASVAWRHHGERRGYRVRTFPIPADRVPGLTDGELLALHDDALGPRTRVLVFPHVDNLVGVRHPVRALTELARSRGVEYVAVDCAQTTAVLPVEVASWGVDFYAASPHKWVQSPKGLGLLRVPRERQEELRALWVTWGQEEWAGSARIYEDYGTRNLPALLALGDALEFQRRLEARLDREARYRALWRLLREGTRETPGLTWRSPERWEMAAPLVSIGVEGMGAESFFRRMNGEGGFVFRPFETGERNAVRISPNLATTEEEIGAFFETARRVLGG